MLFRSIRPMLLKTPYELYKGRKPNISHLRSFGCKCFILNNGKHLIGKMNAKSDETNFMGYALNSKAYRVFNKTSLIVEESIHVVFDETNVAPKKGVVLMMMQILKIKLLKNQRRKIKEIARKIHPWRNCKERKINMKTSLRLGSS